MLHMTLPQNILLWYGGVGIDRFSPALPATQQAFTVNIDVTELLEEAEGDFSEFSFLTSMVDANAAVRTSAIAGFGVNLGLGILLANGTVTMFITGMYAQPVCVIEYRGKRELAWAKCEERGIGVLRPLGVKSGGSGGRGEHSRAHKKQSLE